MAKERSRAARRPGVALRYRLPNPPAMFVGRDREVAWLTSAVDRAPVSVVAGPSGVGKTALALNVIHRILKKRVDRAIYLERPDDETGGQLTHELLRELTEAFGREPVDWDGLRPGEDSLVSATLELAESERAWIVVDGASCTDVDTLSLLSNLASYARHSRWIVCGTMVPDLPALRGQALSLDEMSTQELFRLGQHWAPQSTPESIQQATQKSAGSPWMLRQLLHDASAHPDDYLLRHLTPLARTFVAALAAIEAPLSLEMLRRVVADPGAEAIEQLQRRGLLRRTVAGWMLHPIVRSQVAANVPNPEQRRVLTDALLNEPSAQALLEAIRLLVVSDRIDELLIVLAQRAPELMSQGYVPSLWRTLSSVVDPRLRGWQLECAARLGNPTALTSVADPSSSEPGVRMTWATKLLAEGKVAAAKAVAEELMSTEQAPHRAQASVLLAKCLRHRGATAEAIQLLSDATTALAFGQLIGARADRGEPIAHADLMRLEREVQARQLPAHDLAAVHHQLGQRSKAMEVLAEVNGNKRGSHVALFETRRALLLKARIQVEWGQLAQADAQLNAVRPYSRGSSLLRPFLLAVDMERRFAAGDFEALSQALEQARIAARPVDVGCARRMQSLHARLCSLQGRRAAEQVRPGGTGVVEATAGELRALAAARFGEALPRATPQGDPASVARVSLASAAHAVATGGWANGALAARQAFEHATRAALAVLACEALEVWAAAVLCAGDTAGLRDIAGLLSTSGKSMPSPRFLMTAQFLTALAEHDLCPGQLEKFAGSELVAPVAARRAQALLGGDPRLDRIDEHVINAVRAAGTLGEITCRATSGAHGSWAVGWGLDLRHQRAWLPNGRLVELRGSPLSWSLLTLLSSGDDLSKETLAEALWPDETYHPFTHDGRIHVAVRKLRDKLEQNASKPKHLLTTPIGYRLGAPFRTRASG